ncbi:MAG: hypothetical protein HXS48_22085 [Theionarchaea archaeon]|nr:hypothetical protein [Theionarchaea archaeon]
MEPKVENYIDSTSVASTGGRCSKNVVHYQTSSSSHDKSEVSFLPVSEDQQKFFCLLHV